MMHPAAEMVASELNLPENSPKFIEKGFVFLLSIAESRLYFYKLNSLSRKISEV
jgi:hypothetical protein